MNGNNETSDEAAIRTLLENWAGAVRARDFNGILANHSADMLMFDLPGPLELRGIDAYRKSWDPFFACSDDPVIFRFTEMAVTAGDNVAFVAALMQCSTKERTGERIRLSFRLTVGLRKIRGQWTVTHEHHSIPSD